MTEDLLARLLLHHHIDLTGEVCGNMADYVRHATSTLIAQGSPDISVLITSHGGDAAAGFLIYDSLRLYPGKKTTRVIGYANSMAALLVQAGTTRECARNARMFFHNVLSNMSVPYNRLKDTGLMREREKQARGVQNQILDILTDRSGRSRDTMIKLLNDEREVTALEARRMGLIDKIV
ncbi:MAG: ATP-dependent Clp protease proteolytic subunit [Patescibacteria group bacterium]